MGSPTEGSSLWYSYNFLVVLKYFRGQWQTRTSGQPRTPAKASNRQLQTEPARSTAARGAHPASPPSPRGTLSDRPGGARPLRKATEPAQTMLPWEETWGGRITASPLEPSAQGPCGGNSGDCSFQSTAPPGESSPTQPPPPRPTLHSLRLSRDWETERALGRRP